MRRAWPLALALLFAACGSEVPLTEIVIVVWSDQTDLTAVDFDVTLPSGETPEIVRHRLADAGFPLTLGVQHVGGPLEPLRVQVSGVRGGVPVVATEASVAFVVGESRMLRLDLLGECGACAEGTRCTAGGCEASPATLDPWTGTPPCNCEPPGVNQRGTCDAAGECGFVCDLGFDDCDSAVPGCETDFTTSAAHCGRCGRTCGLGDECFAAGCGEDILATGGEHGCVLYASGRLACPPSQSVRPGTREATLGGITGVHLAPIPERLVAFAESPRAVCGLDEAGRPWCYGANNTGQLGRGGTNAATGWAEALEVVGASEIAGGGVGTSGAFCAIVDRALWCWGAGSLVPNAVDDPTPTPGRVALESGDLDDVTEVALGGRHGCLLREGGALYCWGTNTAGQVGDGTMEARGRPTPVEGLEAVRAMALGLDHTCVIDSENDVRCWGSNEAGALGIPDEEASRAGPLDEARRPYPRLLGDARSIAAFGRTTCALLQDETVWCWGAAGEGFLGPEPDPDPDPDPDADPTWLPRAIAGLEGADAMVVGFARVGDRWLEWGRGRGPTPAVRPLTTGVVQVSLGQGFSCARRASGAVLCWGRNNVGQLGIAGGERRSPVVVGLEPTDHLAVGTDASCATDVDGSLWCWGDNAGGQLGTGGGATTEPAAVAEGVAFDFARVGEAHACARDVEGQLHCWGTNTHGRVGDGTTTLRTTPVGIDFTPRDFALAAASFALIGTRTLSAWGRVREAENPTTMTAERNVDRDEPSNWATGPTGYTTRIDIAGPPGLEQTGCVAGPNGIACFGTGARVGLGGDGYVFAPEPLDLEGARDFAVGPTHTCAVDGEGELWCWGSNASAQLGVTDLDESAIPTLVPDVSALVRVAVGEDHTCAIDDLGRLYCWGGNTTGQLGDDTAIGRPTPTRIEVLEVREPD